MMSRLLAAPLLAVLAPAPLLAQQPAPAISAEEAIGNAADRWSILAPEVNPCAEAERNADPDVIVVCRAWEDGARYTFERPVRADTQVTGSGAPRAPDVSGLLPCSAYQMCMKLGSVPPPAIMVDFDSLPETPAGSEAARLYGGPTDAEQD